MALIIYQDSNAQPIKDQIKINNRPTDLTGFSVKFRMRHAESGDLKIDEDATLEDAEKGLVLYQPTDLDLDNPGEYFGWWNVDTGGGDYDTKEFLIIVTKHSPGLRVETGAIYRRAKGILPITWSALEDSDNYGDSLLQEKIEVIKLGVFGQSVPVQNEATYDIRVQDYIARLVVLSIIPSGIDYWLNQHESISTQGGPAIEIATYPDRIKALEKIQEQLLLSTVRDRGLIETILDVPQTVPSYGVPGVSDGGDCEENFVTPLPNRHFRDYAFPGRRTDRYGWGTRSVW